MKLTGKQIGELRDALTDAFDRSSLEMMLVVELEKRLDLFSGPDDFQSVVFQMILAAERGGWTEDLIRGACNANPGNEQLKRVAAALLAQLGSTASTSQGTSQEDEPSQSTIPPIDPDNPPILQIRTLLRRSYSAETLQQFCNNRATFREILRRVGPNEGLDGVIDEVLEYCRTNILWDELLREVSKEKEGPYKLFLADMKAA